MKRIVIAFTAVALALIRSDLAEAQVGTATTSAACCQLTTSLGNDQIRGSDVLGDERFFMAQGAPPNIHFLIDTSVAMTELPQVQSSDHVSFFNSEPADALWTGCTNSYLVAEESARGWNAANSYPPIDTGTGYGSDTGFPNQFIEKDSTGNPRFYSYMSWGDSTSPPVVQSGSPLRDITTVTAMCQKLHPLWFLLEATQYTLCQKCLNQRGFYKKPGVTLTSNTDTTKFPNFVFTGKFLNFNPPKYVTMRWVLKNVIKDLSRVRAGYSYLKDDTSGVTWPELGRAQNPSCGQIATDTSSFDSNRSSYISDINSLRFTASKALIARALFNVGQYFSSTDGVYTGTYGFNSTWLCDGPSSSGGCKGDFRNGSLGSQSRSWCWGCQKSSVIIITGSVPKDDGNLPRSQLSTLNGGTVKCPDYNGDGVGDCAAAEAAGRDDLLDDVAKFLNTKDLQYNNPAIVPLTDPPFDTSGRQSMDVYGVSFDADSNLLRSATEKWGGGLYFSAQSSATLKDALTEAIANIEARATSFAPASVGTLQVNRSSGSLVPRMIPAKGGINKPWQGALYRFNLDSEARLGCVAATAATILTGGSGDPKDLNRDGDCKDSFLLDKAGDAVVENDEGNFVKALDSTVPAVPFWEAGSILKCTGTSNCPPVPNTNVTQKWKTRKIWTIIDNSGPLGVPDNRIDKYDTPVEFKESNATLLRDYLGIGLNPAECSSLQTQLGLSSLTNDECAALVIRWYRGADALNADPSRRDYDRNFLLQDIFHSAPIVVEPLADKTLCSFGTQCLETLFYK
ncbi:MAG TPA: pilus assembly protein PilY, partial [Myxococcaceae bacterium]|nr:pilus assembly protein PilY [Myxococcaceae bacterium]